MPDLNDKYKQKDRLPILVSCKNEYKLLEAPTLPVKSSESSGDLISNEVYTLIEKWKCQNNICSMVFDTTSTNTGHLSAGCVSIQSKLNKALIWSAFRKQ